MSAIAALPFEDLAPGRDGYKTGYQETNEDITIWRDFVRGLKLHKAGGICSSGEVGLFALLPTVRDKLVLVDHSYASLRYALTRYHQIRDHGKLSRCTERVCAHSYSYYAKCASCAKKELELRKVLPQACEGTVTFFGNPHQFNPTSSEVASLTRKLPKVEFVHGDFESVVDRGPFDLFYVSNAHDGLNGGGRKNVESLTKLVRPGGYLLISARRHDGAPPGCKLLREEENRLWSQRMYRTAAE